MKFASRVRDWLRRPGRRPVTPNSDGLLREFVYLDEVSVYSILASRKGAIPTEFTESQTASLHSDVGSSIGVGTGLINARLASKLHASELRGSQVLRKSIIQTSFKELYEIERAALALTSLGRDSVPTVHSVPDLESRLDREPKDPWLVDPLTIRRGELMELEVELETDPIFRMTSIITTLRDLMEDNEQLFGNELPAKLPEMRSLARVLDGLLVGLVPIRGRLVDYSWANIAGRDVLVHRLLLDQLSPDTPLTVYPVFVVGVAQRDLFWKDIRRVLFSQAQYTVFCRIGVSGLANKWHPVKIAGVLAGIVPRFDEMIRNFSDQAIEAMHGAGDNKETSIDNDEQSWKGIMMEYAQQILTHHGRSLDSGVIDGMIDTISPEPDWLDSVDGRRSVFAKMTECLDNELEIQICGELAYRTRNAVIQNAGASNRPAHQTPHGDGYLSASIPGNHERFLDAEIIAIYW